MSVNIFGSRSGLKPPTNQNYNSKFIFLTHSLQTKVDKSGDSMTGNLNMANNKITGVSDPTLDDDVCNKRYLSSVMNSDSITRKLYVDTLLDTKIDKKMKEDFDMNGFTIANTKIPVDPLDAASNLYI